MHLKLTVRRPLLKKTTTTELPFTIEIVLSLELFFK